MRTTRRRRCPATTYRERLEFCPSIFCEASDLLGLEVVARAKPSEKMAVVVVALVRQVRGARAAAVGAAAASSHLHSAATRIRSSLLAAAAAAAAVAVEDGLPMPPTYLPMLTTVVAAVVAAVAARISEHQDSVASAEEAENSKLLDP